MEKRKASIGGRRKNDPINKHEDFLEILRILQIAPGER